MGKKFALDKIIEHWELELQLSEEKYKHALNMLLYWKAKKAEEDAKNKEK